MFRFFPNVTGLLVGEKGLKCLLFLNPGINGIFFALSRVNQNFLKMVLTNNVIANCSVKNAMLKKQF